MSGKRALAQAQRIEVFAQAIIEGKSQADAYRVANPTAKKWKDAAVHVKASAFAKLGKVQVRVQELRARALVRHDSSVDALVQAWAARLHLDPIVLFDDAGNLRPLSEIPADVRRCLAMFEVEQGKDGGRTTRVKLEDRHRSMEMLGRHNGAFKDGGFMPPAGMGAGDGGGSVYQQFNFLTATPEEGMRAYQAMIRHSQEVVARQRAEAARPVKGARVR